MITVVPFLPLHLTDLIVHDYMGHIQDYLSDPDYVALLDNGMAYTALLDGEVLCCAGFLKTGENRADAWALMSNETKKYMLPIVRAMMVKLCENKFKRVQTNVRVDFAQGLKMMRVLGFKNETPNGMKNFGDDGYDYYLYARCV